jgi:hypothetical protein
MDKRLEHRRLCSEYYLTGPATKHALSWVEGALSH